MSFDPVSGSGTYVGGGNHHLEYAYDVPPRPTGNFNETSSGGDYVEFIFSKYDPKTGQETVVGQLDNLTNSDVVHIDPDPNGNKNFAILTAEIPPLGQYSKG